MASRSVLKLRVLSTGTLVGWECESAQEVKSTADVDEWRRVCNSSVAQGLAGSTALLVYLKRQLFYCK